ncbi:MAG: Stp1/IreP family PP2C-type Ser/Thr phosphatase [Ruminococcaceae bacterium]|nr:Stp1/IreP family PP2C-type Ser/Thr phosphatase [Oscillospiraceae bacterium]
MTAYGRSDTGMLRHENQDAYGECRLKNGAHLALVCDGMGGESGGKEAAEICVSAFLHDFSDGDVPSQDALIETLVKVNADIVERAAACGYARMGTTVVLALALSDTVTLLWVGDSRAYLYHGGTLTRLTRDHSYVQELVDRGTITEREARTHHHRHLITRAVGTDDAFAPDVCRVPWCEGDRLLLCSDGLFGMVEEKEIKEILAEDHPLARTAHELICAANSHGGEDNITVLLLENTKESLPDA